MIRAAHSGDPLSGNPERALHRSTLPAWKPCWNPTENAIYIGIKKKMEADGGCTENAIYNVIAATWRSVEADEGQVEAAQDMQITMVRTRMEAFGVFFFPLQARATG